MTRTLIATLKERYFLALREPNFVFSFILSLFLLGGGFYANYLAGSYATEIASNSVTDIFLSNIPVYNVDDIFVYGPIIFWSIISLYCLYHPKKMPFWLKTVALFIVIRSLFMTLTHIGPFPDHVNLDSFALFSNFNMYSFSSGGDLFFSGHTGLPFLLGLIFWDNFKIRIFCIISAVFFGIVVLLGHLHYTIDVLAAFFITYSIYNIAVQIFPADFKRFNS